MKNKWEILYNPFTRIAGWKAFAAGATVVCATVYAGYCGNAYLTGLSMKMAPWHLSLWQCFSIQATGLLSLMLPMYLISLFFTRRVRPQDVAGTVLLSRIPWLFMALLILYFNPVLQSITEKWQGNLSGAEAMLEEMFTPASYVMLLLFAVLLLGLLAWYIALLYQAFRVSTGIKGRRTGVLLAAVIIVSETAMFLLMPLLK
jgi:hypothetical protein